MMTAAKIKLDKWQRAAKKVEGFRDGLGKSVDKGIRDTIIALNALGIHTTASCEGHLQYGLAGPWVDIKNKNSFGLEEKRLSVFEKDKRETKLLTEQICRANLRESKKLLPYLEKFYRVRKVKLEDMLIIGTWGLNYGRLQNQGLAFQEIMPKKLQLQKMKRYQKEMRDFGEYLKSRLTSK